MWQVGVGARETKMSHHLGACCDWRGKQAFTDGLSPCRPDPNQSTQNIGNQAYLTNLLPKLGLLSILWVGHVGDCPADLEH